MGMIAESARKYVGVPFLHQGRNRQSGLDCIGLLVVTFEDLGMRLCDRADYKRFPDGKTLTEGVSRHFEEINPSEASVDDLLLFFISKRYRRPQHLAIRTELGIVHSHLQVGRVVEHRLDDLWSGRVAAAFRGSSWRR